MHVRACRSRKNRKGGRICTSSSQEAKKSIGLPTLTQRSTQPSTGRGTAWPDAHCQRHEGTSQRVNHSSWASLPSRPGCLLTSYRTVQLTLSNPHLHSSSLHSFPDSIRYFHVALSDEPGQDILRHFKAISDFIGPYRQAESTSSRE